MKIYICEDNTYFMIDDYDNVLRDSAHHRLGQNKPIHTLPIETQKILVKLGYSKYEFPIYYKNDSKYNNDYYYKISLSKYKIKTETFYFGDNNFKKYSIEIRNFDGDYLIDKYVAKTKISEREYIEAMKLFNADNSEFFIKDADAILTNIEQKIHKIFN